MKNSELRHWLNVFPEGEIVIKTREGMEIYPNVINFKEGKIVLLEASINDKKELEKINLTNSILNGHGHLK